MDYTSKSHGKDDESKETPEKNVEKVVTGEVIQRKRGVGRRFKDIFFGGDARTTVNNVTSDVLIPAIRNAIVDFAIASVERFVYGDTRSPRRSSRTNYSARTAYHNPAAHRYPRDPRESTSLPGQPPYPPRTSSTEANEIILSTREEADAVIERLVDIIERYEVASLLDLYSLVGLPTSHSQNKWGWQSLRGAKVKQIREGYLLELPPYEPI